MIDSNLITTTGAIYSKCTGTFPTKITDERCEDRLDGDQLFWLNRDEPE